MSEPSIQVITWMGRVPDPVLEPYYFPQITFASIRKFGYEPVVLGEGQFRGLGSKVKTLKAAINSGLVEADYILMTDSFDVIFDASPVQIVEEFRNIQAISPSCPSVLWNAEKSCFPRLSDAEKYPVCPTSYKYLNSGWGIAELAALKKVFSEEDPDLIRDDYQDSSGNWITDDDQRWWTDRFFHGTISIALDTETRICNALHNVNREDLDFSGEKIRNIETGNYPLVWHLNGNGKNSNYRDELFKKLGH